MDLEPISLAMQSLGLHSLGICPADPADGLPLLAGGRPPASIMLVGNTGSSLWPAFSTSPEYRDARPHPLDRWSRRVGDELADCIGGVALYPFDGPPYWPFQAWAGRSGETSVSPLSLLINRRFGLWHAYRFALGLAQSIEPGLAGPQTESPCLSCSTKPCLEACPVGAFASQGYRLDACVGHLNDAAGVCLSEGCLARRACPIATRFTYTAEHLRFHMRAFVAARPGG